MKRNALTLFIVAVIATVIFAAGCSAGGKKVFTCSSDNILGLESVKVSGNNMSLIFDSENAMRTDDPAYGVMREFFEKDNTKTYSATFFINGVENVYYPVDGIDINPVNKTITIDASGVELSNVTGLRIRDGMESYEINFEAESITAHRITVDGYGFDVPLGGYYRWDGYDYEQAFDPGTNTWTPPEIETYLAGEMWT